jgi:hypothetical protein
MKIGLATSHGLDSILLLKADQNSTTAGNRPFWISPEACHVSYRETSGLKN